MKNVGREGREALGVAIAERGVKGVIQGQHLSASTQGSSKKFEECGPYVLGMA